MRNNSLLLRRIIFMLVGTMLIGSVIVGVIYSQRSKDMFAEMKAQEYKETVLLVYQGLAEELKGLQIKPMLNLNLQYASNTSQAQVFIMSTDSSEPYAYAYPDNYGPSSPEEVGLIMKLLTNNTEKIVANNTTNVAEVQKLPGTNEDYLVVAQSLLLESTGEIAYIVFLTKPVESVTSSLAGLNQALFLTFVIVFVIIMLPLYFGFRQVMAPLSNMRDIALSMAQGDFDLRANEQEPGEIGQLSRTLNYLAGTLSHTISELKVERNRLRRIIDGLSEGIIAMDADLNVTHVNPSICELLEIDLPEGGSHLSNDIVPLDLLDDFQRVMEESCSVVRSYHWKNMVLRVSIAPLTNDFGYTVGAVGLFNDITESERLEQTRREFVANVSHELRTPLSALRGLAEVLNDDMLKNEDDKHRYYGYILRESLRLNRLVDDLLELSRLQSGSVSTQKGEFDISEAVNEIHEKYAMNADDMDIKFDIDIRRGDRPETECPMGYGNADRFEQVCVILLDNALKYTNEGGSITLGVEWDDDKVYISVKDTGVGIAPEDREYVFDRFYKVDKAHTGGGTGLGLSIARELMTLMDERIWIADTPEGECGSTFVFTITRADAAQLFEAEEDAAEETPALTQSSETDAEDDKQQDKDGIQPPDDDGERVAAIGQDSTSNVSELRGNTMNKSTAHISTDENANENPPENNQIISR